MIRDAERRSPRLLRRLAELSRRRACPDAAEAEPAIDPARMAAAGTAPYSPLTPDLPREPVVVPIGIEELLAGGVLRGEHGSVFVHERLRSSIERADPAWGRLRVRRTVARRTSRTGLPGPDWLWEDAADEAWRAPWESEPDPAQEVEVEDDEALHEELRSLLRADLRRVVFLDLETGGLGGACVFLAGVMR